MNRIIICKKYINNVIFLAKVMVEKTVFHIMAQFLIFYVNSFTILFSLLMSIKSIDNFTHHYHNNELETLNRNKRDVFPPNILKIRIINENKTEMFELSKLKSDHLVNWNATLYKYYKSVTYGFEDFGLVSHFKDLITFYYSEPTHSAVVLYNYTSSGDNYLVNGIVGEKYSLKYKRCYEIEGITNIIINFTDVIPKKTKKKIRSIAKVSETKIGNPNENPEFYLETLVFIDGALINEEFLGEMKTESNRQKLYIMQVLSFFNVINMLFSTTNFKINIAGIIFSESYEDGGFYFLQRALKNTHQYNIPKVVDAFYELLPNLPSDLKNRDSFDCIFHLTDFSLYDTETDNVMEGFLSYPSQGIYQARKSGSFRSYPLIVSNSSLNYPSVANAAHHFFHLIGGANYIRKYNNTNSTQSTIIRDFDSNCSNCYDWTEDYCVFINKPRIDSSAPSILVSKNDQCWCYDYSYKYNDRTNTSSDICTKGFQCELNEKVVLNVTLVLDGTPCETNKVCWNKICTQIV